MNGDFNIFGVYVPALMGLALVAFILNIVLRRILAWVGFYKIVWHRALFDLALYVILLGGLATLSQRFVL